MAFRFFTRKKLFPGITLNLSRSGPSISVGPRGLRHTIGARGRRTTVGLPGTGLHYSVQHGKKTKSRSKSESSHSSQNTSTQHPTIDPQSTETYLDREFLRGVVAFQSGAPLNELRDLESMVAGDAQWVFGVAALLQGEWSRAVEALRAALLADGLGKLCARNGVSLQVSIPITPEVTAHIEPAAFGTKLALVEALQAKGDRCDALNILRTLNNEVPDDFVVAMSLAEVAFEIDDDRLMPMETLADILSKATPNTDLAWALAFHTARARTRSGSHMEAIDLYDRAMQDPLVPDDVRMLAWYEKALTHGEAGERTRCRQELSAIYVVDKTFADVGERLRGRKS